MLPVEARLVESRGFKAVYSRGRSCVSDLIVLYTLVRPGGNRVRIGFSVGKKIGVAVQRNRAKRLLREASRHMLPEIGSGYDIVIVARKKIVKASFADVALTMEGLFTKAGLLCAGRR